MRIGVDVGGTFTDFSCISPSGRQVAFKLPSTPDDPSEAVILGLRELRDKFDISPRDISMFAHGTTVATNAVLERKGATVGLITTEGFRDVLEIGRQMRQKMYSIRLEPETPVFLAPGRRRVSVNERIGADGAIIKSLDENNVLAAVERLRAEDVNSLAITLLFSFMNPIHERRIKEIVIDHWPDMLISLSSEVDPVFREYERTVVTAFDAYIKPTVDSYLSKLKTALLQEGVTAPLQVMQSRGGLAGAETARMRPVRLFLSGPAGGVIGGLGEGKANTFGNLITVDIGGTSCDIALISESKPLLRQEGVIDKFSIRVPMVDVNAIGAGGGSIAWIDESGGLRVGPHSAGSEPGPACYDRGGVHPTVTDASLVSGLLDKNYFAGGRFRLNQEKSCAVIDRYIAKPLGISVEHAALGIQKVLISQMSEGVRFVSIKQGFDPREFVLLALGGAGPLYACALAEELNIGRVLVPRNPGVLSATGLLNSSVEHEISSSFNRILGETSLAEVSSALSLLDAQAQKLMLKEAVEMTDVEVSYAADICYLGQGYYLEVPLEIEKSSPLELAYQNFLKIHDRIYGHSVDGPVRIVNLRTVHKVPTRSEITQPEITRGEPLKVHRDILIENDGKFEKVPVLQRAKMPVEFYFEGPAIVEQNDTTTWIPKEWCGTVLNTSTLLLEMMGKKF